MKTYVSFGFTEIVHKKYKKKSSHETTVFKTFRQIYNTIMLLYKMEFEFKSKTNITKSFENL